MDGSEEVRADAIDGTGSVVTESFSEGAGRILGDSKPWVLVRFKIAYRQHHGKSPASRACEAL